MKDGGFSLIEVLTAMALALLLIVGAAELLTASLWAKRKGDLTAALTHALVDKLESLKALPFGDAGLAAGGHTDEVRSEPGGVAVEENWDVAEAADGLKRVRLAVKAAGRPGPAITAVLFISRDLGFEP